MKKLELYKNGDVIYRILDVDSDNLWVIDCVKQTMPFQLDKKLLDDFIVTTDADLSKTIIPFSELTNKEKERAESIFSSISPIIPFVSDPIFRNELIERCSNSFGVSKQTIRKRLCDYLCYQSISVFINRKPKKALSNDELIIRKALNKFFYNSSRISLKGSYIAMLREYYLDNYGNLKQHPSFSKYKRFYYSNRKESTYLISRYGRSKFDRDFKLTLSNGVAEYYKDIGVAELDSTQADIWLVNEQAEVVGRPIISIAVDPVTTLCLGVYIGFEETRETIKELFLNIVEDKVEFCKKHSIEIEKEQWPNSNSIPRTIVCDRGKPYISNAIQNLTEIGATFVNLAPYHASDKGTVEHYFFMLQSLYKEELVHSGVIRSDIAAREQSDYRKDARITLEVFKRIVIKCILYLNNSRIINLPYKHVGVIQPFASKYYVFKLQNDGDFSIQIDSKKLELLLLPRTIGKMCKQGLVVNKLRYRRYGYLNECLAGKTIQVAFNRLNVSTVYLIDDDKNFIPFEIVDKFFEGKTLDEADHLIKVRQKYLNSFSEESILARTNLSKEVIEYSTNNQRGTAITNHKKTKQKEIRRLRREEN